MASLMASARGVGAPATSPLDYKKVTPAVMAGVWEVPFPPVYRPAAGLTMLSTARDRDTGLIQRNS